ncbi:MAG: hypothetical protein KDJ74_16260 [Notoacmeibacter sp.]|nr:hypothetical protein [Notoacmeibacter sp.]
MTEKNRPKGAAHARVRFRRHEIPSLDALPSAQAVPQPAKRKPVVRRAMRIAVSSVLFALVLVVLAASGIWIAINAGLGRDRIGVEAEAALARMYGFPVTAAIGETTLSFDGGRYIAFEIRDVDIRHAETGQKLTAADAIRLGVRPLPLLGGDIRIGSIRIVGAHASDMASGPGSVDPFSALTGADGLTDPDSLTAAVFNAVSEAFAKLDTTGTKRIALRSTVLNRGDRMIEVSELSVTRETPETITISAEAAENGTSYTLQASAGRDVNGVINRFDANLTISGFALKGGEVTGIEGGPITLALNGSETGRGRGQRLSASVNVASYKAAIEAPDELAGSVSFIAQLRQGAGKIEISSGNLAVNNSRFPFTGAIGPDPVNGTQAGPAQYRFEVVTNDSRLSPMDTQEPAITFGARLAGTYTPDSRTLNVSSLGLRTSGGEVMGSARFIFGDSAPAIFFALRSRDLPVSHAKQLWPWLSAPKARDWVVKNLFDGTLVSTELELASGPGRLTDGIPYSADEIHGRFEVVGTRFDIAGDLPPVRDADGVISFAGNDVDIELKKGSAWTRSGRIVKAANGRMEIRDAHLDPVVGKLDLSVEGAADAIVELASRKPIEAGEKLGIGPEKFTGSVKGKVKAAIPLEDEVKVADINWSVALDFANLAIDKEFDGQKLSSADGTIAIDPRAARISAKGKLNGMDARLVIVEPIGPGGPAASQEVTLDLSAKSLASLAPGLDGILEGPVSVKLSGQSGKQAVEADLGRANLSIPWMGWSKGAGVPGTARFVLDSQGRNTTIRDLKIEGKSFQMAGDIRLVDNSVSSMEMSRVRLNRDDNFTVSMSRSGAKGMNIALKGASMDARALIRQFSSSREEALSKVDRRPMKITARLDKVIGFDGEALSDVRMDYQGNGDTPLSAAMTGITDTGAAVRISHSGGSNRALEMATADAGSVLRFLDLYGRMRGGNLKVALAGTGNGPLAGQIDISDFMLVNEPRLASLVGRPAPQSDGRSLNDAVKKEIDVSRVKFDRGFVLVEKGEKYLNMSKGVLRGPLIGTTFQGKLYDARGRMAVTGTFMPAYGLNRIFGEIPVLGFVLGNGRDRGLIGITYKLAGDAKSPDLQVNPISVIAPGIFRSIFEFR